MGPQKSLHSGTSSQWQIGECIFPQFCIHYRAGRCFVSEYVINLSNSAVLQAWEGRRVQQLAEEGEGDTERSGGDRNSILYF
jgi:hypothetical protein